MARRRRLKTLLDSSRDLISELPIDVKDRILKCLPTRDAARTALLSRHWNHVWLQHGQLVLDRKFFQSVRKCQDDEGQLSNSKSKVPLLICRINKFEINPPKLEILCVISSMHGVVVESRWLAPHLKVIKTLWLSGPSLMCMDASMFPTAINLQVMKLYGLNFGCPKQLAVAMQLLTKCPNLCELRISTVEFGLKDDKEAASMLLEDPNSCFVSHELKMLNTIKIESNCASALQMLFIIMLLPKSPALERFIVKFWGMNAPEVRKILRKLECFPRASSNAHIVFTENDNDSMGMEYW